LIQPALNKYDVLGAVSGTQDQVLHLRRLDNVSVSFKYNYSPILCDFKAVNLAQA
jgi:hypothetical protein